MQEAKEFHNGKREFLNNKNVKICTQITVELGHNSPLKYFKALKSKQAPQHN